MTFGSPAGPSKKNDGVKHRVRTQKPVHNPTALLVLWGTQDAPDSPEMIASEGSICETQEIHLSLTAFLSFQTAEGQVWACRSSPNFWLCDRPKHCHKGSDHTGAMLPLKDWWRIWATSAINLLSVCLPEYGQKLGRPLAAFAFHRASTSASKHQLHPRPLCPSGISRAAHTQWDAVCLPQGFPGTKSPSFRQGRMSLCPLHSLQPLQQHREPVLP